MNNFQLRTLRCPNISTQPGVCKNNNEEKSIIEYNVSSGFTALRRGGGRVHAVVFAPFVATADLSRLLEERFSVQSHRSLRDDTSSFRHAAHAFYTS